MRVLRSFALLLAVGVGVGVARAQPTAKPLDEAKAHFEQAKAYQDVGAFLKAAAEYKAAYEASQLPELLFDVAQAYRLADAKQEALDYFKKYLDLQPNGAGAREARIHVATLTKQIDDAIKSSPATPPATPAPPPTILETPPQVDLVESGGSPRLKIAGIATLGAGLVSVGIAVKLGRDANNDASILSQHVTGTWTLADRQTFEDGQRANREMIAAYVIGGALVATGGVLYWFGSRTHVTAVVIPQTVGLALSGSW